MLTETGRNSNKMLPRNPKPISLFGDLSLSNDDARKLPHRAAVAVTVGPVDNTACSGVLADLRTFTALAVRGAGAVVSLGATSLPDTWVREQLSHLIERRPPDGLKIGRLAEEPVVRAVADLLPPAPTGRMRVVADVACVDRAGEVRSTAAAQLALKTYLLPAATVAVMNVEEASLLTERRVGDAHSMKDACKRIFDWGPQTVVITGGRLDGPAVDLLYDGQGFVDYGCDRIDGDRVYGRGSTFGAALCALLARGESIPVAVERAKTFTFEALSQPVKLGDGWHATEPMAKAYEKMAVDPTPILIDPEVESVKEQREPGSGRRS